jgi:hypothetical protein
MARQIESVLQQRVMTWWRIVYRQLGVPSERMLFAIPNGGGRDIVTASRLKAEGVRAGMPDLFLAVPRIGRAGLFIELKTPAGRPTPLQREVMAALELQGYGVAMPRSVAETVDVITEYLATGRCQNVDFWLARRSQPFTTV